MNSIPPSIGRPLKSITYEQIRLARILLLLTRLDSRQIAGRVGAPYEIVRHHIGPSGKFKIESDPPAWAVLLRRGIDQALAGKNESAAAALRLAADELSPRTQNPGTAPTGAAANRKAAGECVRGASLCISAHQ